MNGQIYSDKSSRFVESVSLPISWCFLSVLSVGCNILVLDINKMFWCFVLYSFRHLVNHIVPLSQLTSGLCLTNQLYSKNMSMLFESMTTALIFSIYSLIPTFSGTNLVTSLFLVLFALNTLNDLFIGSVLILSSFISCLFILVYVYPESTSALSYDIFLFDILMFVYTLSFLSLLSLCWEMTYWFRDLLYIEVCYTMSTPNPWQNPSLYCFIYHLFLLVHFGISSSVLTYSSLQDIPLYCTCNTFWFLFLLLASDNSLPYIHRHCNWIT